MFFKIHKAHKLTIKVLVDFQRKHSKAIKNNCFRLFNQIMPNESKQIQVLGIDTSNVEFFFESKEKQILKADRIAAPARILETLKIWLKKKNLNDLHGEFYTTEKLNELIKVLKKDEKKTIIFSGGDPLWFGVGRLLIQNFSINRLYFEPAATSFQLAFSKLGKPWQATRWVSLHGRDPAQFEKALKRRPSSLVVLTDPNKCSAAEVFQMLQSMELDKQYEFWTFERLGYSNERIMKIQSCNDFPIDFDPLHLVILFEREESLTEPEELPLFGINDSIFLQNPDNPGLMTKREIRIQILAELNLPKRGIIWDIGCGVGSIGLEALRISPNLRLVSIDKRIGSKNIIEKNSSRLGVVPSLIIEDDVLNVLEKNRITENLLHPDRVIVGGGGSNSQIIIDEVLRKLNKFCILVIPLISLKSLSKLESFLRPKVKKLTICQHQSYRGLNIGEDIRLSPLNPVFILTAEVN